MSEEDELLDKIEELKDRIYELEEKLAEYQEDYVNIDNFIQRLKIDNLYDEKIENFIEEYLKYYNK